jgi:V/A-type H+-transporting ATPase subunit K
MKTLINLPQLSTLTKMIRYQHSKLYIITMSSGFALAVFALFFSQAFAQESPSSSDNGITKPLLAIAAAIAIAGGLIGTGNAQQGIGAAGMGIIAEKPEKFGQVLFFFVIPETLWIIGFVLGIILLLGIL